LLSRLLLRFAGGNIRPKPGTVDRGGIETGICTTHVVEST
jgi:hypothetical protein